MGLHTTLLRSIAFLALIIGVLGTLLSAQSALASGNNGACEAMTDEINMGTPEDPVWTYIGFHCEGPCPGLPDCVPEPQLFWNPIYQGGAIVGYEVQCYCYYQGDPQDPFDDIIQIDQNEPPCETVGTVNVGGSPTGSNCLRNNCPAPCRYGQDPNVSPQPVEFPPGSGQWYDARCQECQCNGQ